jgi:hypothetical protein
MGLKFYALVAVAALGTAAVIHSDIAVSIAPPTPELAADRMGQIFLQYRTAVATFQRQNPTYSGSVSIQSLNAIGFQFPQDFIGVAGNSITPTGANGRVVTSFAVLPAGAGAAASRSPQGDASLGVASGPNWVSYSNGVSTPLSTAVPNGAVVSVIQIGN